MCKNEIFLISFFYLLLPPAIDLINNLLQVKMRKRYSVDKSLSHPWLQVQLMHAQFTLLSDNQSNYMNHNLTKVVEKSCINEILDVFMPFELPVELAKVIGYIFSPSCLLFSSVT